MINFRIWILALLAMPISAPVFAKDIVNGNLILLEQCPGDKLENAKTDESLFLALLSPLITGVINQGIKTIGHKLSDDAKEASIDVLHVGDHFYVWTDDEFTIAHRCLIVASKGTDKSNRDLSNLVSGYQAANIGVTNGKVSNIEWSNAEKELESYLSKTFNYQADYLPGLLGVFDVELSAQRTEARLVPRFVVLDHSVREEKTDKKSRTITFEFSFSVPGQEQPFGALLIKLDKLRIAKPFVQTDDIRKTSNWYVLPPLNDGISKALSAQREAEQKARITHEAAELALAAAVEQGFGDPKIYLEEDVKCPAAERARNQWIEQNGQLEKAKNNNSELVGKLTSAVEYYRLCTSYHRHLSQTNSFAKGDQARSYDVTVELKEFRKRPFSEFFGGVLSDDTTRGALTTALVDEIDPAKRAAASLEMKKAYETAVVAAELAIVAYESASTSEKASKYIDMEAKQRAANRAADDLGVAHPYPEAGTWIDING